MKYPGFVGPSNPARSRTVDGERTLNLIVEQSAGTPKSEWQFYNRPAAVAWTYIAPGPVRALFFQDGRLFAVSGGWFYEIYRSRNVMPYGQVTEDSRSATICSNGTGGNQLFITSGGDGYIFDLTTNVLTPIADPEFLTPSFMGAFSDGYFLNLQSPGHTFQISALEDGTSWNGLDVAQVSESSDAKIAIAISHRELWFFGTKNTEVWYNSGSASFPYQPISGVFVEHGIAAPYSVVNLDNTLYWLGQDAQGRGLVWRANGYTPEKISTLALDTVIASWPHLHDVVAFSFQIEGHAFYALYSPHAETTWMYDIASQSWTEWSEWDEQLMRHVPFIGRCAASGWGFTFIGDRQSGAIYVLDMNAYADFVVWRS